ncbi:unnamed protein product [Agarophyton chilense]
MMCTPRQRGAYHAKDKCGSNLSEPPNPITDYCPHCLNGGTVATVKQNLPPGGWKEYDPIRDESTMKRAGLCGDPRANNDHMLGGKFMKYDKTPIVKKWKSGSVVDLQVEVDTNHNGYFEFFLCDLDTCGVLDISEKCFKKHCYPLKRTRVPKCQSPTEKTHTQCGPIDEKYPSRFYVPCRKTGHVGIHLLGGDGTMLYKLPDGVSCAHCVLQWYWASGNSCAPRGFLNYFEKYNNPFGTTCDSDGGGKGAHRKGMGSCGGQVVPEEFWSCADVSITESTTQQSSGKGGSKPSKTDSVPPKQSKNTPPPPPPKNNPKPTKPQSGVTSKPGSQAANPRPQKEEASPARKPKPPQKDRPKRRPTQRRCVNEHGTCNGKVRCCGSEHVCVYKPSAERFMCEIWWKLWSEVKGGGMDRAVITEGKLFDDEKDDFNREFDYEGYGEEESLEDYMGSDKEL